MKRSGVRRVLTNSSALFVRQVVNMALGVFLVGFVLRHVSSDAYGVYLLVVGWRLLFSLIGVCVKKGCTVWSARSDDADDPSRISRVLSTSVAGLTLPAVAFALLAWLFSGEIATYFVADPRLEETMVRVFLWAAFEGLFLLPLLPFEGVIEARERYDVSAAIEIASSILRAGVIVAVFLTEGGDVEVVMIATVAATLMRTLTATVVAFWIVPGLRFGVAFVNRDIARALVGYSGFLILSQLAFSGSDEVSKWIVARRLGPEFVTFLGIPLFLNVALTGVMNNVTLVLVPMVSQLAAQRDAAALREVLIRGTRYTAVLSAAAMALFLPTVHVFLTLWVGEAFAWLDTTIMAFGAVMVLTLPHNCALQVFDGAGDARRPFISRTIQLVLTSTSVWAALAWFDVGFPGAVAGLCFGLVANWLLLTAMAVRGLEVSAGAFLWQSYLQPWLPCGAMAVLAIAVARGLEPSGWVGLVAAWALPAVAFPLLVWPFMTDEERELVGRGARRSLGR